MVHRKNIQCGIAVGPNSGPAADLKLRLAVVRDPQPVALVQRKVDRCLGPVRGVLDQDLHIPLDEAQSDTPEVVCENRGGDQQENKQDKMAPYSHGMPPFLTSKALQAG